MYHSVSREVFAEHISTLKTDLAKLNEQQVIVELMRITNLVGDGHTQFSVMGGPHHHYPFSLKRIGDVVRVAATDAIHAKYLHWELVSIDGIATKDILRIIDPLIQGAENDQSMVALSTWHLNVAELLNGAGIAKSIDTATFVFRDDAGQSIDIQATPLSMNDFVASVNNKGFVDIGSFGERKIEFSESLWSKLIRLFSDTHTVSPDSLWLSSDIASSTAYLYFSDYPSAHDMDNFSKKVKGYLSKHNIQNLIIDLRNNTGGDFFVGLRLAQRLQTIDSLNWDSGIYVLIGGKTYSAGMSNATQFRRILNARLVGEPTGSNPVGYQDTGGLRCLIQGGTYSIQPGTIGFRIR